MLLTSSPRDFSFSYAATRPKGCDVFVDLSDRLASYLKLLFQSSVLFMLEGMDFYFELELLPLKFIIASGAVSRVTRTLSLRVENIV